MGMCMEAMWLCLMSMVSSQQVFPTNAFVDKFLVSTESRDRRRCDQHQKWFSASRERQSFGHQIFGRFSTEEP